MEKLEILFGFHFPEFEKELSKALSNMGYDAKIIEKHTKMQIREYILMHRECQVVILKERDETMSFTAEDFALLTDENDDLNVICVLSEEKRGTDYMQILYAAGITNAVFQNGNEGVRSSKIATLCIQKRSRKEARKYYGIASVDIDIGMLSPEAYSVYYQSLFNEENGRTLILRYLNVASRLTASQNEDFLNRLPKDLIDELREYEEFFVILDGLKAHGIDMKYKRPKHLKIAMEKAPAIPLPAKTEEGTVAGAFDFGDDFDCFDFGEEFLIVDQKPKDEAEKENGDTAPKEKHGRRIFYLLGIALFLITAIIFLILFLPGRKKVAEPEKPYSEAVSKESPVIEIPEEEEKEKMPETTFPDVDTALKEVLEKSIDGGMVKTYINRYPETQFLVVDGSLNKQVLYQYVTVGDEDIRPQDTYLLSKEDGKYVFTKQ